MADEDKIEVLEKLKKEILPRTFEDYPFVVAKSGDQKVYEMKMIIADSVTFLVSEGISEELLRKKFLAYLERVELMVGDMKVRVSEIEDNLNRKAE